MIVTPKLKQLIGYDPVKYKEAKRNFNKIQTDFMSYWKDYLTAKARYHQAMEDFWDDVDMDRFQTDDNYAENITIEIEEIEEASGYTELGANKLDRIKELINAGIDALSVAPETRLFKKEDIQRIRETLYIEDKWKPSLIVKADELAETYMKLKLT